MKPFTRLIPDIADTILQRKSCRTYTGKPLTEEDVSRIHQFLNLSIEGPFHQPIRFLLIAARPGDPHLLKGLGTYGFIKNPAGFIVGAAPASSQAYIDYGYLMELIVLYLSSLDIGTCWLGATFRKSRFAEKINLLYDEIIPSIVSFGYPVEKPTVRDKIIRRGAGSDSRFPFKTLFFEENFNHPFERIDDKRLNALFETVQRAPSASNRQPWRIVLDKRQNVFHFYLNRSKPNKKNNVSLHTVDLQQVDMGIAMAHFESAADSFDMRGYWQSVDPAIGHPLSAEYIMSWVSNRKETCI